MNYDNFCMIKERTCPSPFVYISFYSKEWILVGPKYEFIYLFFKLKM